ncbi:hypothetical protein FACS1894133_2330 [Clostridia bacterium]|nr:hypothetical protein FACS1894133_2330 [Clostridia bacterium]
MSWTAINFLDNILDIGGEIIGFIGSTLENFGNNGNGAFEFDNTYGIDYMGFAEKFEPIFRAFGYTFCILFIGINLMEKAMTYELFSIKGGMRFVGGVLLSKVWVDCSTTICKYTLGVTNGITTAILKKSAESGGLGFLLTKENTANIGSSLPTSSIPIVGDFINFQLGIVACTPIFLMLVVVIIICAIIMVKLVLRTFEIAMLIAVSPLFFACIAGDTTRQYFRKFILTFLGVAAQLVFMSLVYAMTREWYATHSTLEGKETLIAWAVSLIPWDITMIAMGIMMVKPPKILTNLVS